MKQILILGASSDIAQASAHAFIKDGWKAILAGRNLEELQKISQDLKIRNHLESDIESYYFDTDKLETFETLWKLLPEMPDAVLCAVGYLGNQKLAQENSEETAKILNTNFNALVPILNKVATDFEKRKSGLIIGISSVAGDRGRASNYIYGAAKAAFTTFFSGLRNRLAQYNIAVITVKPGFVDTRMTKDMGLPPMLTATPQQVADDIIKAVHKKRNIVYTKWFWFWIMQAICLIPESLFKKMKI